MNALPHLLVSVAVRMMLLDLCVTQDVLVQTFVSTLAPTRCAAVNRSRFLHVLCRYGVLALWLSPRPLLQLHLQVRRVLH